MKNIFKKISFGIICSIAFVVLFMAGPSKLDAKAEYFRPYKDSVFEYSVYPYSNLFKVNKILTKADTITIPRTITYEGKTFYLYEDSANPVTHDLLKGKTNVKKVIYSEGIERICGCSYASSVQTVVLPSTAKYIDAYAFNDCTSLTSINLPESICSIGNGAFCHSGITTITIPSKVKRILSFTFNRCNNLESVKLPDGMVKIGTGAFSFSGLKSINIPKSVTSIESSAFRNCVGLTSVKVSSKVEYIEELAFMDCSSLKTFTIKSSKLKRVGYYAFKGTPKKVKFSLPKSKKASYKKMLKSAGASKKAKFK